jgi:cytoskeletal protein CcmA (bactofilin family)/DNA-directed RNA polymerase subunit RPC12/RpoP
LDRTDFNVGAAGQGCLMPATKKDTIQVTCPRCGYSQPEPRGAYSSICKNCRQHFRLEEALKPSAKPTKVVLDQRHVRCFQCGTELDVPKAAASTMCKRCSSYVDLSDYRITETIAKNFRTHGWLVVEEKGYLLNTDSFAAEAVIKGRVIGKVAAHGSLELHTSAQIKGSFTAGKLVIPSGHHFRWPEPLRLGGAEISGELVANVNATGTVVLKASARFFGDITAGHMVVEPGAVFVGNARIGAASTAPARP